MLTGGRQGSLCMQGTTSGCFWGLTSQSNMGHSSKSLLGSGEFVLVWVRT